MTSASCYLADEAAQLALGHALAPVLTGRTGLVFLQGDLGSGKTTLVRGILRGLGVTGHVRSPTYTLIEPYAIPLVNRSQPWSVFHLDLYRLAAPMELETLGWRELFADGGLLFIEWPERAETYLPSPDLQFTLREQSPGRHMIGTAQPEWADVLTVLAQFE